ncbi:unnamed protein product [Lymnaea stagnalis]|uniref:PH domain-containing protein n=1 Tax=Lymnaea stagnalis TaxID=6523 RepID=A0AAV2HTN4_LYMST
MKILNERGLAHFANSGAPPDKEGYLHKKGELNKGFQKRWFVLKGNLLFYFEHKADREPIGVIILEGYTIELAEDTDNFTFMINFAGSGSRSYSLCAATQESMESWMKALSCAGYEYIKLMVSELQSQLEETSKNAEANLVSEAYKESKILGRIYNLESSPNSKADSKNKISKRGTLPAESKTRKNPFNNLDLSGENDPGDAFRAMPKVATVEIVTWSILGVKSFYEMHEFVRQQIEEYKNGACGAEGNS